MLHIYAVGKPKRKPPVKPHYSVEIVYYDKYLLNDSNRNLFIQLWL